MSSDTLTAVLFIVVILITVGITFWASRQTEGTANYYAGGRSFSGFQNGMAISGDYMSAASFLGISGAIALSGYDGFLYSIGFLVAWLVALLLVAELLRNSGKYTMADQLAYRMRQRPVRTAASTSTVVVSIFYLLAQMVGAGALVTLLLGVTNESVEGVGHRRSRPADDLLRHGRRHEGHDLGADRQGRAADVRHDPDHGPGAGEVQLQPLRPARCRRGEHRQGRGVPPARPQVRRHHDLEDRLRQPEPGAGAGHRRTSAHPDPLLHRPDREGRADLGAVGHRPDRRLLPDDAGAGLRRRCAAEHRPGERGRDFRRQLGLTTARPRGRWR